MAYNKKQILRQNIDAIRSALSGENDPAKLSLYSGFGGLKSVIYDPYKPELYPASEQDLIPLYKELHDVLKGYAENEEEYQKLYDSVKKSIFTAFYTPTQIVNAIQQTFTDNGITIDKMLDPSSGTGRFLNLESKYKIAYEKDYLTAKILHGLHPNTDVRPKGYETIPQTLEGTFDCAVTNVPFGQIPVFDPRMRSHSAIGKKSCAQIHNYFFLKTTEMLRDGGITAFITSTGTCDSSENKEIRKELMRTNRLVSAVRLPDNTFTDSGTRVLSDMIVLQKCTHRPKELTPEEQAFVDGSYFQDTSKIIYTDVKNGTDQYGKPQTIYHHADGIEAIATELTAKMNNDFAKNFDKSLYTPKHLQEEIKPMQAGEIGVVIPSETTQEHYVEPVGFGSSEIKEMELPALAKMGVAEEHPEHGEVFRFPNKEQAEKFNQSALTQIIEASNEIASSINEQTSGTQLSLFFGEPQPALQTVKNAESTPFKDDYAQQQIIYKNNEYHTAQDGEIIIADGKIGIVTNSTYQHATTIDVTESEKAAITDYLTLKEVYYNLYYFEEQKGYANEEQRTLLNKTYDDFVTKYGHITDLKNNPDFKTVTDDPEFRMIRGLENVSKNSIEKSEIFFNPIAFSEIKYTIDDAFFRSLDVFNEVNFEYIAALSGTTIEQCQDRLEKTGMILYNPVKDHWESTSRMLSGNILQKIDEFSQSSRAEMPATKTTIEELEKVLPEKIPFEEIGLQFGERWIPEEYYQNFAQQLFQNDSIMFHYDQATDHIKIYTRYGYGKNLGYYAEDNWSVKSRFARSQSAASVFESAFFNNTPPLNYTDSNGRKYTDVEAVKDIDVKVEKIHNEFTEYLLNLPKEKQNELEKMYNDKFNSTIKEKINGDYQTFPGLDLKSLGYEKIRKSQSDAIIMLKTNGGGIIDHEVGNGKTLTLCVAAHEMKRIGKINKPLIIGMKANLSSIVEEYQRAYPNAKILYPTKEEIKNDNIENFLNKIRNNNYDCIFLTHDQFLKIPQSSEIEQMMIQEEITKVDETINQTIKEALNPQAERKALKELERTKESLTVKLESLQEKIKERKNNNTPDFGNMGIDHILVDECHVFKNLRFFTRHQRVKGLGTKEGSQRAYNLLMAIRTIQSKYNEGIGATFSSGTTITNSMSELYSLFNYLIPDTLEEKSMQSFDAWASVFMKKNKDYEFNVVNNLTVNERFREFVKVPELSGMYNMITDYKTAKDAGIQKPEINPILVNIKPTPTQEIFFERLKKFIKDGSPESGHLIGRASLSESEIKAKSLIATDTALKAALDMRLIDPRFPNEKGNKINALVNNIKTYYDKFNADKGTQLVFLDYSTDKGKNEWSVYQEIKKQLIATGIPESEIAISQRYSEKQKPQLYKDVNEGKIRVVIGSTSSLGTGVNVQQRCIAMHHMDIPWRSSDIEQRNGRGSRQGNELATRNGNKIDTFYYCVERSLDNYKLSCAERKLQFIQQLKSNTLNTRTIDEGGIDDKNGMSFQEYIAILSGDTTVLEKAQTEKKVQQLESMRNTYAKDYRNAKLHYDEAKARAEKAIYNIQRITEDYENYKKIPLNEKGEPLNYKITLNGVEYTDQKAAGEALLKEFEKVEPKVSAETVKTIGDFYGFKIQKRIAPIIGNDLFTSATNSQINTIEIRGRAAYHFNNGIVSKTSAAMFPLKALARTEGIIVKQKETRTNAEQAFMKIDRIVKNGLNFPHQEELDRLKGRLTELNDIIDKRISSNEEMHPENSDKLHIGELPFDNFMFNDKTQTMPTAEIVPDANRLNPKYTKEAISQLSYNFGISETRIIDILQTDCPEQDKISRLRTSADLDLAQIYFSEKLNTEINGMKLLENINNTVKEFVANGQFPQISQESATEVSIVAENKSQYNKENSNGISM